MAGLRSKLLRCSLSPNGARHLVGRASLFKFSVPQACMWGEIGPTS